jgi:hypothetical protein
MYNMSSENENKENVYDEHKCRKHVKQMLMNLLLLTSFIFLISTRTHIKTQTQLNCEEGYEKSFMFKLEKRQLISVN